VARAYECSECYLVQMVEVIENGLGGFADPHVVCQGCGAIGQFHFAPGTCEKTAKMVEDILADKHEAAAAHVRNTAGCCDGYGQVYHGEGALSYVTLCRNRECLERGVAAWTDPQHETPALGDKR
jgi:hypothetical protein